jgi:hypothetical protein
MLQPQGEAGVNVGKDSDRRGIIRRVMNLERRRLIIVDILSPQPSSGSDCHDSCNRRPSPVRVTRVACSEAVKKLAARRETTVRCFLVCHIDVRVYRRAQSETDSRSFTRLVKMVGPGRAVKRNLMSLHVMVFVIPWSSQCQLQFASAATGA